ncbi:MAG TPA: hypothetical protein VNZ52_14945, partial [Candidatus Thermoplasmatota archaeon]|nr:hypothetical protein [Candidatus Thermoplasmatota archaeon]
PFPAAAPAATPFVDPVGALAAVFQGNQYETMRDLQVAGATYALAAHRAGGKRVLVSNVDKWDESQQAAALQGAETLGADVLLVVAKEISPGARLAAWGTKLQVLSPAEAVGLKL